MNVNIPRRVPPALANTPVSVPAKRPPVPNGTGTAKEQANSDKTMNKANFILNFVFLSCFS